LPCSVKTSRPRGTGGLPLSRDCHRCGVGLGPRMEREVIEGRGRSERRGRRRVRVPAETVQTGEIGVPVETVLAQGVVFPGSRY